MTPKTQQKKQNMQTQKARKDESQTSPSIIAERTGCHSDAFPFHSAMARRWKRCRVVSGGGSQKRRKYASLIPSYVFAPVLNLWGHGEVHCSAKDLIHKIGQRVKENSGESRSTSFLIQRLALVVQHGNAASVLGTIPATRDWREVGLLPP